MKPIDPRHNNPNFADLLSHSLATDTRLMREALGVQVDDFGEEVDVEALVAERDKAAAQLAEVEKAREDLKNAANAKVKQLTEELEAAKAEVAALKKAAKAKPAETPKE